MTATTTAAAADKRADEKRADDARDARDSKDAQSARDAKDSKKEKAAASLNGIGIGTSVVYFEGGRRYAAQVTDVNEERGTVDLVVFRRDRGVIFCDNVAEDGDAGADPSADAWSRPDSARVKRANDLSKAGIDASISEERWASMSKLDRRAHQRTRMTDTYRRQPNAGATPSWTDQQVDLEAEAETKRREEFGSASPAGPATRQ